MLLLLILILLLIISLRQDLSFIIDIIQKWVNHDFVRSLLLLLNNLRLLNNRRSVELLRLCLLLLNWGCYSNLRLLLLWLRNDYFSLLLESFNSFNYFDPVETNFNIEIIFQVLISNEVNHGSIYSQFLEVFFVLWQL